MAGFDFPTFPNVGQEYTSGGVTYRWNGYGWAVVSGIGTGGVIIADEPPTGVVPGQLWWENDTGILWLWYDDGDSQQWMQATGTSSGAIPDDWVNVTGDTMTGNLKIVVPGAYLVIDKKLASVAGGVVGQVAGVNRWAVSLGDNTPEGSGDVGNDFAITPYTNAGVPPAQGATFRISRKYGSVTVRPHLSGSYAFSSYGGQESGAVIGYGANTAYYGISGAVFASTAYSFYGNCAAFLSSGIWGNSDARFKTVDTAKTASEALPIVIALRVKPFTWIQNNPIGRGQINAANDFGWLAQDVEALIPQAVHNAGTPPDDLALRAFLAGTPVPQKDSSQAKALSARTDLTVKTINEHYLLAVLWQAVQELTARVTALEGGA